MNRLYISAILTILLQACSEPEPLACTPANLGAEAFQSITGYVQQVRAIAEELAKTAENPADFFVKLNESEGSHTAILWHESSFKPENCNRIGNSSGLNRTYIIEKGKVKEELGWL